MLLEFSCSNFKSIYKKITLSMLASSDDTREEDLITFEKYRVNRMTAIYGPNGSGKTNVLQAVSYAKRIILGSMKRELGDSLKVLPHKLAGKEEPTEFAFQFVTKGVRYAYGFSIIKGMIQKEYLYYFPNNRQTKIFDRMGLEVSEGPSFKKFSEASMDALKDNRLFLACAANYTKVSEIEAAFLFFKEELKLFSSANGSNRVFGRAIEFLKENPELKPTYLKIMDYLGTGIKDIEARAETVTLEGLENTDRLSEEVRKMIKNREIAVLESAICYEGFKTDLESEESVGIKKLFVFLYPYLDVLRGGKVLLCDEIETGLHESIAMGMLKLFTQLYPETNAQIIFTTHDTSLLDGELLRRDQIWFTELDGKRSTDLYSLAEIRNVRKTESLKNGYVSGKYGAIPMLNKSIFDDIVSEFQSLNQDEKSTSFADDDTWEE
ncbi:MAG: AAA family ATPase [Lachnospiraceae bacterium]|nr:AAA family ATPase [Lachnospiraceae bacterium]